MQEQDLILNKMLMSDQAKLALDILYRRHGQSLFEFLYIMLGKDENKARDIVHDTFLRVFEKRVRFDASRPFRPWLFRIAVNLCRNERRRIEIARKNHQKILYNDFEIENTGFSDADRIWDEVALLGPDHQEVIILRYKTGLQVKEIAQLLDCPEGTVKSRLFYALRILSQKIKIEQFENKNE